MSNPVTHNVNDIYGKLVSVPSPSNRAGFFVGQRVWSIFYGPGEVVADFRDSDDELNRRYPLRVKFNDDDFSVIAFTSNGHFLHTLPDPKMDIVPRNAKDDDHATLPVAWPGPVSRFLFSVETLKARVLAIYMLASAVVGGAAVAVVMS